MRVFIQIKGGDDKLKFKYELCGIGWADAYIEINGSEEYFSVSYITDALRQLLEGVMSLLPECTPVDELKNEIEFKWHAEPGGDVWNIKSISYNQLQVRIESYRDLYEKIPLRIEIDEVCNKMEFIRCVINEMDNIIKSYGFVGYRETWYNHDFPISAYLKLKNYLMTDKYIQVEHIERYTGNEYLRSDLNKELMMFKDHIDESKSVLE